MKAVQIAAFGKPLDVASLRNRALLKHNSISVCCTP
jgi:hypothetical protein